MIQEQQLRPLAWIDDSEEQDRLLRLAIRDAFAEHKRIGTSIVVWEDGKIVTIPAEEIVIPEIEGDVTQQTAKIDTRGLAYGDELHGDESPCYC